MPRKKGETKDKEQLLKFSQEQNTKNKKINITDDKGESEEQIISKPYKCCCCGKRYVKQKDNFPFSQSPFFKGNNSYLPICSNCIVKATDQYTEILKSQDEAIKRVCMHWDIYINDSILSTSRKIDQRRPRIKECIRQCNLVQNKGKTYDDYLFEKNNVAIMSEEDIDAMEDSDARKLERNIKTWGTGYSAAEFEVLNNHYKMLTKQLESADFVQETLCRELATIKVMQNRSLIDKDYNNYDKLTKLYQSTLSTAKLKPTDGLNLDDDEACFGVWLGDIEKYAPSEYYKDKNKYRDFFGIGEYIERFMYRPLKNLITGSKEKEKEFWIDDEKEEE